MYEKVTSSSLVTKINPTATSPMDVTKDITLFMFLSPKNLTFSSPPLMFENPIVGLLLMNLIPIMARGVGRLRKKEIMK